MQRQQLSWHSFTLGNKQDLLLVVEGDVVSIYSKSISKKFVTLTSKNGS